MSQNATRQASPLGFTRSVPYDFETAVQKVTEALQKEGFGVLSDIDVKATLKKKLDVERPDYRILGACNAPLAKQALEGNLDVGLLLPCNVTVYKEQAEVKVSAVKPTTLLALLPSSPALREVAEDAEARLERVISSL